MPDFFQLNINQKTHFERIEKFKNDFSLKYLLSKKKFILKIQKIIKNKIKINEAGEAKSKIEPKAKSKKHDEEKAQREAEERTKKELEEKTKREAEKKLQKETAEKLEVAEEAKKILDNIILKGLKLIEETAKNKAEEEKSQREAEEKAIKEAEKKAGKEERTRRYLEKKKLEDEEREKLEVEKREKLEALQKLTTEVVTEYFLGVINEALAEVKVEEDKRELDERNAIIEAKLEAEAQAKQQIEEIKDRILAKTSANFEKFQSFFDHLREVKWLEIKEIGLFGSRVYREVISETCPSIEIPNNPKADFDFYCISGGPNSIGAYRLLTDLGAQDIFQEIINKFNATNPNLQISFLEEKDGKKSVNMSEKNQSSNFKLVATFLEDKVGEEKTEKIVKEKVEFDLNFYTQQSMLKNLQWQFNLERVLLVQNPDQTFALNINHCNCNAKQEKMTVEEFFAKAQGEEMREFLFESNPQAQGFLNRMINKKGIYKYLDEDTFNALKSGLSEDEYIKENLKKELLDYKNIVDDKASKSPESKIADERYKQAKFILDEIAKDEIFKEDKDFQEILGMSPRASPTGANVALRAQQRI